jgi:hypothetical protein
MAVWRLQMSYKHVLCRRSRWLAIEALTFGLAYGASLCWFSVCLMASFRPNDLSAPYWHDIPSLRSDTSGVLAFFAAAVFLTCSEFLRLRRRAAIAVAGNAPFGGLLNIAVLAASETVAVLSTGLVIYLSVNAVTHPVTLSMRATHLASWPTEGTLRVIALLLCVCSANMLRFLRGRCSPATPASGNCLVPPPDGGRVRPERSATCP